MFDLGDVLIWNLKLRLLDLALKDQKWLELRKLLAGTKTAIYRIENLCIALTEEPNPAEAEPPPGDILGSLVRRITELIADDAYCQQKALDLEHFCGIKVIVLSPIEIEVAPDPDLVIASVMSRNTNSFSA